MSQSTARWRQPAVGRLTLGISLLCMVGVAWAVAREALVPILMWDTLLHAVAGVAIASIASAWWREHAVVVVAATIGVAWELVETALPGPAELLHRTPDHAAMAAHDTLLDVLAVVGGGLMVVWLARQHNE